MKLLHRAVAVAGGLALMAGGVVVLAPAANADAHSCYQVAMEEAPNANEYLVSDGCRSGSEGNTTACIHTLQRAGLPLVAAGIACDSAIHGGDETD
ncbi:hypothetical protein ACIQF6_28930 [Kitasatospora sp. NPDC092948]|uniref:hypothetical protein n=1 Tax=Kitasatospora sp. NPDC092948 TaxID=3364088 RepID=UPI003801D760